MSGKIIYRIFGLILLVALTAWSPAVQAAPITLQLSGITYFDFISAEATLDYDGVDTLIVDLKNTSTADRSSLTGFAFNAPEAVTGVSSFSGPAGWSSLYSVDGINTPMNLGFFDVAGITGPNFNGGKVADGIPQGSTFSFSFVFSGSNLNLLSTQDFVSLLTAPQNSQSFQVPFAARFQGIYDTGVDDGSDVATVPIPGAVWLLGSGLAGVLALRRKA